jgi:flagellin FlaB
MNWKKVLTKLSRQKRAIIGLEAAIILIAFVIIAAVFSFMVVNQGLFATQRGQSVIQEGLQEASCPLAVDGQIFVRTNTTTTSGTTTTKIVAILVPLKAYGVASVPMWQNETAVSLTVGTMAWANIYSGVNQTIDPTGAQFDTFLNATIPVNATLFIQNSNHDEALDSFEKGFLVINLGWTTYAVTVREPVNIEIRLEKSAPLSIPFNMPMNLPPDSWLGL